MKYRLFCSLIILIIFYVVAEISNDGFISIRPDLFENMESNHRDILESEPCVEGKNMKVFVKNQSEIEMYASIDTNKCLLTRFAKNDWGTWNIKGWYIINEPYASVEIPSKNEVLLAGENTDWEYVFRIINPNNSSWYFSGGNHSNEDLISISFYGYNNGVKAELSEGEVKEIEILKVNENTSLNVDELNIKRYATVERNYIFGTNSIKLATKFSFVKDVFLGTSYVTMFPISKQYGQYIKFDTSDKVFKTPSFGVTETKEGYENYIGKVDATSALMWGDKNCEYKYKVWIKNKEMLDNCNNELKVFLWDINKFSNKLYFSKYDTDNPKKIFAGTVWENLQGWDFIFN